MVACLECLKSRDSGGRERPVKDEVMGQALRAPGASAEDAGFYSE